MACTLSGRGHFIVLSNLPGRRRAGSMRSGLLVAAITQTPCKDSTPSSCVSNWLTTRSVTPVLSWPRLQEHKPEHAY